MGKDPELEEIRRMINYINTNKDAAQHFKEFLNGKPVNINPLPELPEPIMTLYDYRGVFFESLQEVEQIVEDSDNEKSKIRVISYLGRVADRPDVISEIHFGSKGRPTLYTAGANGGCGMYSWDRSTHQGKFVWEGYEWGVENLYAEFRKRGVTFEKDYSGEEKKYNEKCIELAKAGFKRNIK